MKYSTRVLIGHIIISMCIFLFSIIGIIVAAVVTKLIFVILAWLYNGSLDLSWGEIFRVIQLGSVGGGILGIGITLFRLLKVKGF